MKQTKSTGSAAMAIVSLRWNGAPLATQAVRSGGEVVLGDAAGSLSPLPREALGATARVVADTRGGAHVRVPEERVAKLTNAEGDVRLVAGPARVALAAGEEASLVLGAFEVIVAGHEEERGVAARRKVAAGAWVHTAVVASVHAALLFAGSRSALAGSIEADSGPDLERLRGYLAAAEERSSTPDVVVSGNHGAGDSEKLNGRSGNGKQGGGERHSGEAGKAGSATSRTANKRWGAEGSPARGAPAPEVDSIETARDFGMVGLLRAAANEAAVRPIGGPSPWGSDDAFTAMGAMLGRSLGESEGVEGLALSGIGEGGGGDGEGIGLGRIGTIGHTDGLAGLGTGGKGTQRQGGGIGIGWIGGWDSVGVQRRSHRGWTHCRCGVETVVSGRLPPEAVQRIVRQNFGRFRACYEDGLKRNPGLAGRVATRFVIGLDGSVVSSVDGGSDLPDAAVNACVNRAFQGISFPQPEGGIVTVVYPIVFSHE